MLLLQREQIVSKVESLNVIVSETTGCRIARQVGWTREK